VGILEQWRKFGTKPISSKSIINYGVGGLVNGLEAGVEAPVELLLARPDLFAGAVTAAAMLRDSLGVYIGSLWWPVVFC
jgi:hypothetical protein